MRTTHFIFAIFATSLVEAAKTYHSSANEDDDDSSTHYEEVDNDASDDMDWGTDLTSSPKDNLDEGATQEEINAKNEAWKKKAAERESRRIQEREQWQNNFANKVGLGLIIRKRVIVRLPQTKQVTESLEFPNDVPSVPALDSARAASEDSGTDAPDDEGQSAASPSEDHATGGTSEGATSGGDEEASHEEGDGAPTESSDDGVVEAAPSESYIQRAALKGNSSIETTIVEKNRNVKTDSPKANSFVDLDVLHPSVVDAAELIMEFHNPFYVK